MTLKLNNHNVSKAVINHAVQMAICGQTKVIIYGMKDGDRETQYLVSTAAEFESCDNKDELIFVTAIDSDGNYVD